MDASSPEDAPPKEDSWGPSKQRAVLVRMPDDAVCCGVELTPQEATPEDLHRDEEVGCQRS
jgi:hypothetical protein